MTEPLRYGRAKLSTILADFDALRAAVKAHDSFAAEAAWDRCERWLGLIQTATPPLHTDTERRAMAAEAEISHLRAQLAEARSTHDATFAAGVAHGRWLARADAVRRVAAWREAAPGRDIPDNQAELDGILLGPDVPDEPPCNSGGHHAP